MTFKKLELAGIRFGRLIVIEQTDRKCHGHIIWKCQCDCGNITYSTANSLNSGGAKSCGCGKVAACRVNGKNSLKDISGQRYGRLIAIKPTEKRSNHAVIWECACDCGNITYVRGVDLRFGKTKSCGCFNRDTHTKHGQSYTSEYQSNMGRKHRELKKLHDSEWTDEMMHTLKVLQPVCVVCGKTDRENKKECGRHLCIDHVQPLSKGNGLRPGNAVILCNTCNTKKWAHSFDHLPQEMVSKIKIAAKEFEEYWMRHHVFVI